MVEAFAGAKQALLSATCLAHPTRGSDLSLMVDASATHVGACLQQRLPGRQDWQPLGFFSKKLEVAQQKYSAFDRELFACYAGIRHFRYLLEGRRFCIFTDHKPITYSLARVSDPWTARQSRQLSYVAEFTSDIRHVAGLDNVVADTLSRPPGSVPVKEPSPASRHVDATREGKREFPSTTSGLVCGVADVAGAVGVPFKQMAEHQSTCQSTLETCQSSSLQIQPVSVEGVDLWCDVARGKIRPVVPVKDRGAVFAAIHGVAHPGIRATKRLISARFVWKGMSRDVASMCRDCQSCQRGKVHKQPTAPLHSIPVPARRFSHLQVDLVGPLPTSVEGHAYLLTIIDRSTRWVEAIPLCRMEASVCMDAFIAGWVARFGVPAIVTTDRGPQFTSSLWSVACHRLGIKHVMTTAYHPQSNGMVERVHRQIKDALRARGAGPDWLSHLPWVLMGLRAAPKEDSAISSAEMVLGSNIILPGQLLEMPEPPRMEPRPIPTRPVSYAEVVNTPPSHLLTAQWVYVRRGGQLKPLQDPYVGPFRVVQRGAKFFILEIGGKEDSVSVDRLKCHSGTSQVQPAEVKPRGRPRKPPTVSS